MKKFILFLCVALLSVCLLSAESSYEVQKGDTLYSISKKFQLTVAELRTANNLSENDVLKAGQKLVIPEADIGTAAALSSSKNNSKTGNASTATSAKTYDYTVQKGDTLYSLAKKNNISVADLLAMNNLDSNAVIKVGQKIRVPSIGIGGNTSSTLQNPSKTANYTSNTKISSETSSAGSVEKLPDTRNYGNTITADANTKWPVKNPKVTQIKGKVSGVQLSAGSNEPVSCIHEGTVMYVGVYRGFGQVVFVQSKTGLIYAYTGLGSVSVNKGDYIVSNGSLGTAGVDSISGKSQITFMVFQNGQPIDPAKAPRN